MKESYPKKVVIIDDDPTGSQTISNLPVLTEWPVALLEKELREPGAGFFILTNSRSMPVEEAAAVNREVGENLARASRMTGKDFIVISRSDSTLRGHYPAETEALKGALKDILGHVYQCDVIMPFFGEGGRYTRDDIHWVARQGQWIPAAETEFAKDSVFGYKSSNMREWVAEKTGLDPAKVRSISLDDLRYGGPEKVYAILTQDTSTPVIVNAVTYDDVETFTRGSLQAEEEGYRFMYRTAASFVAVRTGAASKKLLTTRDIYHDKPSPEANGGLVIAGSYVNLTTQQLEKAQELERVQGIEVDVNKLIDLLNAQGYIREISQMASTEIEAGKTVVVYTTREYIKAKSLAGNLQQGTAIAYSMAEIAANVGVKPRFVLAKGGITSHVLATRAFRITRARVLGQVYPGVSVWEPDRSSALYGIPYLVFPGNVGDADTLKEVLKLMEVV
ncbi:hypothetical protein MTAT_24430 [Moorella thermoacetica]|uniref:Hydroxyacid dehydrogenase n=1 Tax=Neomoorella thermoacetica TaxID=1525 RepID=A0AAC9MTQ3_NEOTH|nr:four-carbon acid sugar kinase family protein [Moorella thermoacetica]AOQ22920.1 hypothetical protein Maut_00445 [Moorella thermoacetica]TYL10551.1 hypothetical protein MTAT_24430 [Moorella thermoacetica]